MKKLNFLFKRSLSSVNGPTLDRHWTDNGPRTLIAILCLLFTLSIGNAWGDTQVYSTGWESCGTGTDYKSTQTYSTSDADGASWSVYYGTVTTTDAITGSNCLQMRLYKDGNLGYLVQTSNITNVDSVRFDYKVSNTNIVFKVEYSDDDGDSWKSIETGITAEATNTVYTCKYLLASRAAKFRLKISITGGTHNTNTARRLTIDNLVYKTVSAAPSCGVPTGLTKGTFFLYLFSSPQQHFLPNQIIILSPPHPHHN